MFILNINIKSRKSNKSARVKCTCHTNIENRLFVSINTDTIWKQRISRNRSKIYCHDIYLFWLNTNIMIKFIVFDLVFSHKIRCLHLKPSYNSPTHYTLNKSLVWFALCRVTILNHQFVECLWFTHHLSFVPTIVYGSSINSYPSSSLLRHSPDKFKFHTILFILYLLIKF